MLKTKEETIVLGVFSEDQSSKDVIRRTESYFSDLSFTSFTMQDFENGNIDHFSKYNDLSILIYDMDCEFIDHRKHLEKLQKYFPQLQIIFLSNSIENALSALEEDAVYFLLKPIQRDLPKLKVAIERALKNLNDLSLLKEISKSSIGIETKSEGDLNQTIEFPISFGVTLSLSFKDILRFESFGSLTQVYLNKIYHRKTKYNIHIGIGEVLERLPKDSFYRIHKKYIINRNFIKEIVKTTNSNLKIICKDGIEIPIARRKKKEFMLWYKNKE